MTLLSKSLYEWTHSGWSWTIIWNRLSWPQSTAKGPMFSYHESMIRTSCSPLLGSFALTQSRDRNRDAGTPIGDPLQEELRERDEEVSSERGCYSMNYTASCLNVMFDLILTALSGGAASHYARMNMNERGGVPGSGLKHTHTHWWAYERDAHVRTHWATAWDHAFINNGSG